MDDEDEVMVAEVVDLTRSSAAPIPILRPPQEPKTNRTRKSRDRNAWELCEKSPTAEKPHV